MRTIYLICHGEPEFPAGKQICLGQRDLPLSKLGKMQGVLVREYFSGINLSNVFYSRQVQTSEMARFLGREALPMMRFQEIKMGAWEGLTLEEIQIKYPNLYQSWEQNPLSCTIPGGERPMDCCMRALAGLYRVLVRTTGDVAIVSHPGINRLVLGALLGYSMDRVLTIPQPYGCVNVLHELDGEIEVETVGLQPCPKINDSLCMQLLEASEVPDEIIKHSYAVAEKAGQISSQLARVGIWLNQSNLRAAALLHDIARTEPNHAKVGANLIARLGYPEIANMIACHNDLGTEQERQISEQTILYLADKLIQNDREVTLESRFFRCMEKNVSRDARKACMRRYEQAQRVERFVKKQMRGAVG